MKRLLIIILLFFASRNVLATPARIVSLKPNITEILFALGVGNNVVGVTSWCDWPVEAKTLPKVADYININTEKILALKPDLVIGSEENAIKNQFGVLQNAGIKTMTLPFRTMEELYASTQKIADEVGKKTEGEKIIKNIRHVITNLNNKYPRFRGDDMRNERILILVGRRPFVAAGNSTFLGNIIELTGAENIINSKTPYPTVNTEFITAKNPDIIIDLAMGSESGKTELPDILAKKVVQFDMSDFRAGPRVGEAVKKLVLVMQN